MSGFNLNRLPVQGLAGSADPAAPATADAAHTQNRFIETMKERFGDDWSNLSFSTSAPYQPVIPSRDPDHPDLPAEPDQDGEPDPDGRPDRQGDDPAQDDDPDGAGDPAEDSEDACWTGVVHLHVVVPDIHTLMAMGVTISRTFADHPLVLDGSTTVSRYDHQSAQQPVYCDRRMPDCQRCRLQSGHRGKCAPHAPAPDEVSGS